LLSIENGVSIQVVKLGMPFSVEELLKQAEKIVIMCEQIKAMRAELAQ
jgi:hypothetical protein